MEKTIQLLSNEEAQSLYGDSDRYLKMIRNHFDIKIYAREGTLRIAGREHAVLDTYATILVLLERLRAKGALALVDVENALLGREGDTDRATTGSNRYGGIGVEPKTDGQRKYIGAIQSHSVTFGIGPAGTGKTFLACATGVSHLLRGDIRRLVLVRPAVEAGEKLGFLPGDLQAKVNPYLRPIFDALGAVMPHRQVQQYIERDIIEIAPLAYMRGRTLQNAFVVFDEAQNSTPKQMLMLLTRLGPGSKAVITGDISQTDLPEDQISGLQDAVQRLGTTEDVAVCELTVTDIVRHELVQRIIDAYTPS